MRGRRSVRLVNVASFLFVSASRNEAASSMLPTIAIMIATKTTNTRATSTDENTKEGKESETTTTSLKPSSETTCYPNNDEDMHMDHDQQEEGVCTYATSESCSSKAKSPAAPPLLSPFGSYPNPLGITEDERQQFHPIVILPTRNVNGEEQPIVEVKDWTSATASKRAPGLVTEQERQTRRHEAFKHYLMEQHQIQEKRKMSSMSSYFVGLLSRLLSLVTKAFAELASCASNHGNYTIGRYDEDRVGLYESDLFLQETVTEATSTAQEEATAPSQQPRVERRTIHIGLDIGGPVSTPVYAFWDGTVVAIGYNPSLGDYGNVVVIQHTLPPRGEGNSSSQRVVYALYGHLDDASTAPRPSAGKEERQDANKDDCYAGPVGTSVRRGDCIGRIGDVYENGGWLAPHVHFQVSTKAVVTHDMPGAVTWNDRPQALQTYFDPRYITGPLH